MPYLYLRNLFDYVQIIAMQTNAVFCRHSFPYGGKYQTQVLQQFRRQELFFFSMTDFLFWGKTFHDKEPGKEKDALNVTHSVGRSGVSVLF